MHRRQLLIGTVAAGGMLAATPRLALGQIDESDRTDAAFGPNRERVRGLLIGGLIGDAVGGPVEFSTAPPALRAVHGVRQWPPERRLVAADRTEMARELRMLDYGTLRPDADPYGPWRSRAPRGTLTDDSRHKIVLMEAIADAVAAERPLQVDDLARAYVDYRPPQRSTSAADGSAGDDLTELNRDGFREYRLAARWLLGDRDLKQARPLPRLWSGVNNCSGQMMLPPLAACFAGKPEAAYRKAYEIDFIDAPTARDMASSLVAGLAAVLDPKRDSDSPRQRWGTLFETMRRVDPYGYAEVPYAGRPLHRWLDKADSLVERSDGSPLQLFRLLETEGEPVYWWDAHFTLIVPICMLRLADYNPLAALQLILDFGHDTDSYAQVLGCMCGAVHGAGVFPDSMIEAVSESLQRDYGHTIDQWLAILEQAETTI